MFANLPIDLQDINSITIIFRVLLSMLIGGIIGVERDIKQRTAGLRTHMLVCMGAAVVMMTNQYVVEAFPDQTVDITRMGAQVVSGIGFIGAGTILVTSENRIRGLTTAAGLWAAATLGLAIGIGFYEIAVVGGLAVVAILIFLRPFKRFIHDKTNATELKLIIHADNGFDDFLKLTSSMDVKIAHIKVEKDLMASKQTEDTGVIFTVTISIGDQLSREDFLEKLEFMEGINNVVEIDA